MTRDERSQQRQHSRQFWAAKQAEYERGERLEQCRYCLDLYEPKKGHRCG
jgi:hypothetical protein